MNFLDMIKNSVLERFDGNLSVWQVILGLLFALTAGMFILYVYRRTMRRVAVGRSFMLSLLLICAITAMMVLTITSNLALSLGMVGALSIVRFRTAVKDPADTAFLFWAVAAGITSGAGFYLLTLGGCAVIGLVCLLSPTYMDRVDKPFLLVLRARDSSALAAAEKQLTEDKFLFPKITFRKTRIIVYADQTGKLHFSIFLFGFIDHISFMSVNVSTNIIKHLQGS